MFGEDLEPIAADGFSLMAGIVTPKSRGSLRLSGPELDDPLQIDLNALADPDDVEALVASVRQCRAIGRRPALADEWGAVEIYPGPQVSDDELEEYVRATAITYHHQVGTCRMGVDAEAVVDPRLRVHGIDGLRVIDASIMPRITTGNTNAPAALIGELGARFLLEDAGSPLKTARRRGFGRMRQSRSSSRSLSFRGVDLPSGGTRSRAPVSG